MPFLNISPRKTNKNTSVGGFTGHYATLVDVTQDSYLFEIKFYIKWKEILKNQIQLYSIQAYNFDIKREESTNSLVDSKSSSKPVVISNAGGDTINSWIFSAKNKSNQIASFQDAKIYDSGQIALLSGKEIDIYKNALISYNNSGGKIDYAKTDDYSQLTLKPQINPPPSLFNVNYGPVTSDNIKEKNLSLITKHLVDPADIFKISGFFDQNNAENSNINDTKVTLCKSISEFYTKDSLFNLPKEPVYFGSEFSKNVKIKNHYRKVVIPIKKELVKSKFEILVTFFYAGDPSATPTTNSKKYFGSYSLPMKRVEISKHLRFYNSITEKYPTSVTSYTDKLGNKSISAELKALPFGSIDVVTKQINNNGYCYASSDPITKFVGFSKSFSVPVFYEPQNFFIYRTFAKNTNLDITSQQFSSTVVGNSIQVLDTTVVLFRQKSGYLDVEVKNIPENSSTLSLDLAKQTSGGAFERVSLQRVLLNAKNFHTQTYYNLENKKTYRLTVYYTTKDGTSKKSITTYYKYFNAFSDSTISTTHSNLQYRLENNSPVVNFEINSQISAEETDKITKILLQTNIGLQFNDEISKLKEKFGHLLSHVIYRTNLNTGIREVFKQLGDLADTAQTQVFIDDASSRKLANASPLDLNATYLYEISVLKHDPSVILRDFVIEGKTSFGRNFQYKPYRWKQKRVLEEGTYYAEDTQGNLIGLNQMQADEIGVTASVKVPPITQYLQIGNPLLERIDSKKIRLSWSLQTNLKSYDHFVVIKEVNGVRKVLGCFMTNEIIDDLNVLKPSDDTSSYDFGTLLYYVTPVLNDFSVLPSTRSNSIVVDPAEFNYFNS